MIKVSKKEEKRQLKAIFLPSIIYMVLGFSCIFIIGKIPFSIEIVIVLQIILFVLYMMVIMFKIKNYKLKYYLNKKGFNEVVKEDIDIKIQKEYYYKTGKCIFNKKGYERNEAVYLLYNFLKKYKAFKLEESDLNSRIEYILYSLYNSSINGDTKIFYDFIKDIDTNEVNNVLDSIEGTDELKVFINEIIKNNTHSNRIFSFEIEITNIILKKLNSRYLINPDTTNVHVFDPTNHYRYEIIEIPNTNIKYVRTTIYNLDMLEFAESNMQIVTEEDDPVAMMNFENNQANFDLDNHFKNNIKYSIEVRKWDRMTKLYRQNKLETKYAYLFRYYMSIFPIRHLSFLSDNLKEKDTYLSVFKEFLNEELYNQIVIAWNSLYTEKEKEECTKADEIVIRRSEEIYLILKEYSLSLNT